MYFYCLCNPGFEARLKAEAAVHAAELRPSFSRPGFLTFKCDRTRAAPHLTFARVVGTFAAKGDAAAAEQAASSADIVHRFSLSTGKGSGPEAAVGRQVLDIVELGPDEFWWGTRTVEAWGWGIPGGVPDFALPETAPSRAWLKLEEMLTWSRWSPDGQTVLELGSAPGGASWALLNRGATVVGVDVAAMAAVCGDHPRYSHVALSVRDLRKKHLPERIDALFCDLGLKPVEAVPQIRELCQWFPSVQRLYYTLKMGEGMSITELDTWREQLHKLGFTLRCTHLPSNRMEILVAGIRS